MGWVLYRYVHVHYSTDTGYRLQYYAGIKNEGGRPPPKFGRTTNTFLPFAQHVQIIIFTTDVLYAPYFTVRSITKKFCCDAGKVWW